MSQLPLADTTPRRVTGTLFKGLAFAFEPQDIPDGATTLRLLRANNTIIADLNGASIVLIDPEHPRGPDLPQEGQTPCPTPENRSHSHSMASEFLWIYQGSASFHDTLPDQANPPAGLLPDGSPLPASLQVQLVQIPSPLPPNNPPELPKLFEYAVKKPIMFCVPIVLRERGRLAEILRATGGVVTDDVDHANYVVLGQWEENYFDEMWHDAQDQNKPTVTPRFIFDSYENGRLMDPNDYPTRGPKKPWKGGPRRAESRSTMSGRKRKGKGREGARATNRRSAPQPKPSGAAGAALVTPHPALSIYKHQPPRHEPEPLSEDELDFKFVAGILCDWDPDTESDEALWKRMEDLRRCTNDLSWETYCDRNRARFEAYFAN